MWTEESPNHDANSKKDIWSCHWCRDSSFGRGKGCPSCCWPHWRALPLWGNTLCSPFFILLSCFAFVDKYAINSVVLDEHWIWNYLLWLISAYQWLVAFLPMGTGLCEMDYSGLEIREANDWEKTKQLMWWNSIYWMTENWFGSSTQSLLVMPSNQTLVLFQLSVGVCAWVTIQLGSKDKICAFNSKY